MAIPANIRKFLIENKRKDKCEVIEDMMNLFRYKKITALGYYAKFNSNENKNDKERTYEFFRKNPKAINEPNKENAKILGIADATYSNYKYQYKNLYSKDNIQLATKEYEKYYKGRLREKFKFDDSKL